MFSRSKRFLSPNRQGSYRHEVLSIDWIFWRRRDLHEFVFIIIISYNKIVFLFFGLLIYL